MLLAKRLVLLGLLMDIVAAVMIIIAAYNRIYLACTFEKKYTPQEEFTTYCLVSWLGSIFLEGRSIYYNMKILLNTKWHNFDMKSCFLAYSIIANAFVLMFQYSTYVQRFLGETQDHVAVMFVTTILIEAGKIVVQGV